MAREIRAFTATIPAGTTAAAPLTVDMSFPPRVVNGLEIIVPPGPSGLVGFYIANSRVRVIPYASDQWIVTAAEKIAWPLEQFINSGSWQLVGYNTGASDHSIYVRFLLSLPGQPIAPATNLITEADLNGSVDTSTGLIVGG